MQDFSGKILYLDRSDINTDEIIPAKYLTEITKEALKPHCLEDLKVNGFNAGRDIAGKRVIVSRANFGCGSSREHAVWALEVNGITAVVAESFARIFRQNMFNCGLLAIELPRTDIEAIFKTPSNDTVMEIDLSGRKLTVKNGSETKPFSFTLLDFDASLVDAGGWVEFADKRY
ncbi:MAG: 3-isopropylmalate dehydratase small subunit [Fibrobacterota bacterium]